MRRRIVTAVVVFVIAAILLCPLLQMFDRWDHAEKKGHDTETSLMLVLECAGAAIAVMHSSSTTAPKLVARMRARGFTASAAPAWTFDIEVTGFPESPPLPALRI